MSKLSKKRQKLIDRINEMEQDIVSSLTKKSSNTMEINLPAHRLRIDEMKKKLKELK